MGAGKSSAKHYGSSHDDDHSDHEDGPGNRAPQDLETHPLTGPASGSNAKAGGVGFGDQDEPREKRDKKDKKDRKDKKDKKDKKKKDKDDSDDDGDGKKKKKKKGSKDVVKLQVTIKSAAGLRDADFMGQSDPYCILEIPDPKRRKPKVKEQTKVINECRDPVWNHRFECYCAPGDVLNFTVWDKDMLADEFLGRAQLTAKQYYPFGYVGELRLQDTGEDTWSHLSISVKCLEVPEAEDEGGRYAGKNVSVGLWAGVNFEADNVQWQKAHAVVNAMEDDMGLQKEETTGTALDTLVRLAESGLPVPKQAIERVVVCLYSTDRRYRLASLMICKALGYRCIPFATDFGKALNDNDEDVRTGACKVLASFGDAATPWVQDIGELLQDEVPMVRSAALEALGVLSQADCLQALVVLGSCLEHSDKRFRLACCLILKALAVKATPHAYLLVERIEKDPSIDVRIAACACLGNLGLGGNSVQPALVALYRAEHDHDARVSRAATQALKAITDKGYDLPARPAFGPGSDGPWPPPGPPNLARGKVPHRNDSEAVGASKSSKPKGKIVAPKKK